MLESDIVGKVSHVDMDSETENLLLKIGVWCCRRSSGVAIEGAKLHVPVTMGYIESEFKKALEGTIVTSTTLFDRVIEALETPYFDPNLYKKDLLMKYIEYIDKLRIVIAICSTVLVRRGRLTSPLFNTYNEFLLSGNTAHMESDMMCELINNNIIKG